MRWPRLEPSRQQLLHSSQRKDTPAGSRCKSSQKAGPNTRRSDPSHVYPRFRRFAGIELELLRQARVPEPVRSIVSVAWITGSVSAFTPRLRRILIKDIVASNSDARALE